MGSLSHVTTFSTGPPKAWAMGPAATPTKAARSTRALAPKVVRMARPRDFQKGRLSSTWSSPLSASISETTPPEADQMAPTNPTVSRPTLWLRWISRICPPMIRAASAGATFPICWMNASTCGGRRTRPPSVTRKSRKGNSARMPKKVTEPATSISLSLRKRSFSARKNSFQVTPGAGASIGSPAGLV